MAVRYVTLHMVPGTPTSGEWCERCLLPSALRFPVHGLCPEGVYRLGDVVRCPECYESQEDADAVS